MRDTSESSTELVAEGTMTASAQPQPDVSDPAKLIRLGTMLQTMLTELKDTENDEAGLQRLAQIHHETIEELGEILSDDLHEELLEFNDCCGNDTPSESEMRVAHAQLVGWIQGLLRGMQATATAQAQMAQQQMMMMQAQMQGRALGGPGGSDGAAHGQPPQKPRNSGPAVPDSGYL
jgi:hypothetical protein